MRFNFVSVLGAHPFVVCEVLTVWAALVQYATRIRYLFHFRISRTAPYVNLSPPRIFRRCSVPQSRSARSPAYVAVEEKLAGKNVQVEQSVGRRKPKLS